MKNLQEIKDEVYQEIGYKGGEITGDEVDAIAERYARECALASLEKAEKRASDLMESEEVEDIYIEDFEAIKKAISNPLNVILL